MPFQIGNLIITPLGLILVFAIITGLFVTIYISKYKHSPGIDYLALLQVSATAWTFFYFLEYSSTDIHARILWSQLSYLGIAFIPTCFYLFSVNFQSRSQKAAKRMRMPLLVSSLLFIFIVLTNDYHHLHWRSITLDHENQTTIYTYGPTFWLIFVYTYSLLTLGNINIIRMLSRFSRQTNTAIWMLIPASLIPILGNILYVFKINPAPGFDWTPICFVATGTILVIINARFALFDLIPFARQKLIEVMDDGFMTVDINYRIADINRFFAELFLL